MLCQYANLGAILMACLIRMHLQLRPMACLIRMPILSPMACRIRMGLARME
jgi:hypothetical protein